MSEYKWIARDEDGSLHLYDDKPILRGDASHFWDIPIGGLLGLPREVFPEVNYKNSPQPWPLASKETENKEALKVGDLVYHKVTPKIKMCIVHLLPGDSTHTKAANVEYFEIRRNKFIVSQVAYTSLVKWEETDE